METLPDEPTVRDLIHAIGGLTAILVGHLEVVGVTTATRMVGDLGNYAAITAETESNAGDTFARPFPMANSRSRSRTPSDQSPPLAFASES